MDSATPDNVRVPKTNIHQILAKKLKEMRMSRGMTQTQLGEKAGCGQSHISRIEKQIMPTGPTVEALNDIAHVLGIEAWELLVDSEATRQAAYHRMIFGPRLSNERAAELLPPAPPISPKIPAAKRVKRRS